MYFSDVAYFYYSFILLMFSKCLPTLGQLPGFALAGVRCLLKCWLCLLAVAKMLAAYFSKLGNNNI